MHQSLTINPSVQLEVCVYSYKSACIAHQAGAARIELCAGANEGGITPSLNLFEQIQCHLGIPCVIMIRPRGGDFVYNESEVQEMCAAIKMFKSRGATQFIVGCLTRQGDIDSATLQRLLEQCSATDQVSFHRAFDMVRDQHVALEVLIAHGIKRVLTSGGCSSALAGVAQIATLQRQATGRIEIMPGAGVTETNLRQILAATGCHTIHGSFKEKLPSPMQYFNRQVTMSATQPGDEYARYETSLEKLQLALKQLKA